MIISGETLAFMLSLGIEPEKLTELVQRLDADARTMTPPVVRAPEAEELERRRARDRERKRAASTEIPRNSTEVSEEEPPPPSLSPQTPQTHPPTPAKENTSRVRVAKPVRSKRVPDDWTPSASVLAVGAEEGFSPGEIERELANMRDHEFHDPRSDWDATARKWLRTAAKHRPRYAPAPRQAHERPDQPSAFSSNLARAFSGSEIARRARTG